MVVRDKSFKLLRSEFIQLLQKKLTAKFMKKMVGIVLSFFD